MCVLLLCLNCSGGSFEIPELTESCTLMQVVGFIKQEMFCTVRLGSLS